ncbi:unnamed protein product [Bemisia tabaci]|uniref:WAP domain-containing protein n=2 Tax=Bemisia tabaci TaxID=7038 RepID=A0A9P0A111_BEMTA|nr:unnamed protein product [Bemisia tabaci]
MVNNLLEGSFHSIPAQHGRRFRAQFEESTRSTKCAEECLKTRWSWTKAGDCGAASDDSRATALGSGENVDADAVFLEACVAACRSDMDCPGITDKCCPHSCGASCRSPRGLISNPDLPRIPENVTITEKLEKNATHETLDAFGSWSVGGSEKGLVFLVEARHHLGCNFSERKLGPWTLVRREIRPRVNLMRVMTYGRWYQIRVAAVNENGTKGYSLPSNHFQLSFEPMGPEAPTGITIHSVAMVNGSVWAELRWKAPNSSLPITRYRISLGHVLGSSSESRSADVSFIRDFFVPKDQHIFFLRDLTVPKEFMVQVQAYSKYCEKRLTGLTGDLRFFIERGADDELLWFADTGEMLSPKKLLSLEESLSKPKVDRNRFRWKEGELRAHVRWTWSRKQSNLTFEIIWRQVGLGPRSTFAATTDKTYYEIGSLRFNSKYNVTLKTQSYMKLHSTFTVFKTPSCEDLSKSNEELDCKLIKDLNFSKNLDK